MSRFAIVLSILATILGPACRRAGSDVASSRGAASEVPCYSAVGAAACPADPSDPSGRNLPVAGSTCDIPLCRPCGAETTPAFRDEKGAATAGYCICVPNSGDSPRRTLSCFSTDAWKKRG